ncbi:hypothetical protein, partial [Escherichia coli]|uniref:hypothetical protein n=1 Tax=Escherichia coli TaxID=562 RepID=UPI001A7E6902
MAASGFGAGGEAAGAGAAFAEALAWASVAFRSPGATASADPVAPLSPDFCCGSPPEPEGFASLLP